MCPKVKFKKDIDNEKKEKEEENKTINIENFRKTSNNISLRNSFLKTSRGDESNDLFNNNNKKKMNFNYCLII